MVRAAVAFGVIQDDGQIRLGGVLQPGGDLLPGGQPVGQADDRKVVGQGRTQHRPAGAGGGKARHHLRFYGSVLPQQLINEGGHAVNAAVAGADHGHSLALLGFLNGHAAAVRLLGHGGGQIFFVRIPVFHQIYIHRIAHYDLGLLQGPVCPNGHVLIISGADAHNIQLQKDTSQSCSARARVMPRHTVFWTMIFPPSMAAARWHTLSTPVTEDTKAEGGNVPGACRSSIAE